MDKNVIAKELEELDEKVGRLQEPVHQVFDAIENLMNKTKKTESSDLAEFKLRLSEIMSDFYEKMVDVHNKIIEDYEKIEKTIN
jgi:ElaB/YqjD/DUF883 family membrane-anchored ribosome-binding protein